MRLTRKSGLKLQGFAIILILGILFSLASPPSAQAQPLQAPNAWIPLAHNGLNGPVQAFENVGNDVYIGGDFTQTNDGVVTNLNTIARYTPATGTWAPLGNNGLTDVPFPFPEVREIVTMGNYLYVGGYIDRTFDGAVTNLNHIARYNLSIGTWSALAHNGLNGVVVTMLPIGTDIYVGGGFSATFDGVVTNLNSIARYDTLTDTWHPLGNNGLTGPLPSVSIIVQTGNYLYVGGNFNQTGDGSVTNMYSIARYNLLTNTWTPLPNQGLNGDVRGLAIIGSDLYVGGSFNWTKDLTIGNLVHIARYDMTGNAWHPVGNNGINNGGWVNTLMAVGSEIYVGGGNMTQTNDGAVTGLNDVARYDTLTSTWHATPNLGLNSPTNMGVWEFGPAVGGIYVGGDFIGTADLAINTLGYAALLGGEPPPLVVSVSPNGVMSGNISNINITYNKDVYDPAGNTGANDVTNPANYLLVQPGPDAVFNTTVCNIVAGDDVGIPINSVSYNAGTFTATLTVNGGVALPLGQYKGFVCGTTSVVDQYNNRLGGGVDSSYTFTIVQAQVDELPATGFSPGRTTSLPAQPLQAAYTSTGDLTLEIPKLGVSLPVVGVPRGPTGWDVTWLNGQAGYLYGSAYPTWAGNSVITAHVWDASNQPGPFARLRELAYGDRVLIHAWGDVYTFEVRSNYVVVPTQRYPLKAESYPWLTLLTCEGYDTSQNAYLFRRAVQAVLVDVAAE